MQTIPSSPLRLGAIILSNKKEFNGFAKVDLNCLNVEDNTLFCCFLAYYVAYTNSTYKMCFLSHFF